MRFALLLSLIVVFICINESQACKAMFSKKRMICYFASWAGSRASPANIQPEDFDPCLCTHVLYSFVDLRNSRLELKTIDKDLFARMANWKLKNPTLKVSLSIGGWNEQSTHFTPMVATQENRNLFCQSVIDTCRMYGLDGVDIDWEYPSVSQKQQYTDTMQTCYDLFTQEAKESGKKRLLLTAATAPDGRMDSLDIPALNNILDFIMPMVTLFMLAYFIYNCYLCFRFMTCMDRGMETLLIIHHYTVGMVPIQF
jgi:chitinase